MNNEIKVAIRSVLEKQFGIEEVLITDEGVTFDDFGTDSKIYFEEEKVIYVMENEDASVTIKASKKLFLEDVEKGADALYNWGLTITEGDRENSCYDDEENEDFVRENLVVELEDEDFLNFS
jgi:hypothetical protein